MHFNNYLNAEKYKQAHPNHYILDTNGKVEHRNAPLHDVRTHPSWNELPSKKRRAWGPLWVTEVTQQMIEQGDVDGMDALIPSSNFYGFAPRAIMPASEIEVQDD